MSSLSLSILILAVIVALGIAAQSLWVLQRDKKRTGGSKSSTPPAPPAGPVAEPGLAASAPITEPGEPRLSLDDVVELPQASGPTVSASQAVSEDSSGMASHASDKTTLAAFDDAATATPGSDVPANAAVGADDALAGKPASAAEAMPPGVRALHDDADCLVEIPLVQATSGDRLLGLTKSIRRAGGKPVAFEGLTNVPEPRQGEQLALPTEEGNDAGAQVTPPTATQPQWEALRHGVSYKRLRAGILLSNRQGPLNAMEFSEFTSKLQGLASQLGVPVDLPEMNATLQRARGLDALLADCDVQLGLAVDCGHALRPQDLAALARRLGLFERGNNRFACLSEAGEVIYSVALGDKAQRLQLMFDVPRVAPGHMPWWKMAEAAHQAAVQFEGKITDDGGRELSEQSFRNVAIALEGRQQALAEAGVPAGSALAMRVFN